MNTDYKITKEEHHWTSEEKLRYCGYGEWVEEPDLVDIEYLGYDAIVVRLMRPSFEKEETYHGGHLCGYVKVPRDHPYFGKNDVHFDCHYGITFNEAHEEHYIGFDCAHLGDYIPATEHFMKTSPEFKERMGKFPLPQGFENSAIFNPVYRNVDYCIKQCLGIIKQLDALVSEMKVDGKGEN